MKCPHCGAEIPDVSRFCLSCGKETPPPKQVTPQTESNPDPSGHAMLLFALSFMMFFFMLVPIFMGVLLGAVLMAGIGCVLILAGVFVLRSNRKHIEKIAEEKIIKVKCRYCGSLNDPDALRCISCGATL